MQVLVHSKHSNSREYTSAHHGNGNDDSEMLKTLSQAEGEVLLHFYA